MTSRKSRLVPGTTSALAIIAIAATLFAASSLGNAAQSAQLYPPTRELILRYDLGIGRGFLSAEVIVAAVERPSSSPEARVLFARLGRPLSARFMISDRLQLVQRLQLGESDPLERLQRFVVLTYQSDSEAQAALTRLRTNPNVVSIEANRIFQYQATPGDPYFQPDPDFRNYQWGMRNFHAFEAAWDLARGIAYVGVLDNGIQLSPSVHPDLGASWRPQFARNMENPSSSVDELQGLPPESVNAGHGSHVAGIVAADTNDPAAQPGHPNAPPIGVAGACWHCSLMIQRVTSTATGNPAVSTALLAAGLERAIKIGAQVVNMSVGNDPVEADACTAGPDESAVCTAMSLGVQRDVVMVAAAGNDHKQNRIHFPARDSRTIAVGGISWTGDPWVEDADRIGSNRGPELADHGVVAPAADVASTVYAGREWNPGPYTRCGDSNRFPEAGETTDDILATGYGRCTGTSMSTPHVTGIVALMRSVNPLLTTNDIKSRLFSTASNPSGGLWDIGFGTPNAQAALTSVLTTTNRLTPLFSLKQWPVGTDYYYTIVPQMGSAATNNTLAVGGGNYAPLGPTITGYPSFPGGKGGFTPGAQVWVFTTHVNPMNAGTELSPIHRLSYSCALAELQRPICATDSYHVDHAYVADLNDLSSLTAAGYQLDGIEGYVYPNWAPQPPTTTRLIRARNPSTDDFALFPESESSNMTAAGYVDSVATVGFAYPNTTGSRPPY